MPNAHSAHSPAVRHGALVALTLLVVGSAGCAAHHHASQQRKDLDQLARKLPGQYDNRAQAQLDPSDVAVDLLISPLQSTLFGDKAFYVRESVADDPRRVLGQRMWMFAQDKDGKILQLVYLFKDPQRWLELTDEPDLLLSLLPADMLPLASCSLIWSKSESGYEAVNKSASCQPGKKADGALIEQSMALHGDELTITAQQTDADGRLQANAGAPSTYRFERRGAVPDPEEQARKAMQNARDK